MYGRGYGFYGVVPRTEQWKYGGVRTIRDGILFDAQYLLREAEWHVEQEGAVEGEGGDGRSVMFRSLPSPSSARSYLRQGG